MRANESSPSLLSTLASSSLQNSLYNSLFFSLKYLALYFQPSTSNPSLQLLPVFLALQVSTSSPLSVLSNFFLHALSKSISEKLSLTSFQSCFSFLSTYPTRFLPIPLLICSLLRDVFISNRHHGMVVVSLAMCPCKCEPLKKLAPILLQDADSSPKFEKKKKPCSTRGVYSDFQNSQTELNFFYY